MVIAGVITPWVYEVRDLISGVTSECHISRLIHYEEGKLLTDIGLREQAAYLNQGYEVDRLVDLRETRSGPEIEVQWFGFPSGYNSWESAQRLYEDVPDLVEKFLEEFPKQAMAKRVARVLGVNFKS